MIPQKNRLSKARVQYILKKGNSAFSKVFTVKYTPSKKEESRFCVVISKKLIAKAVPRNKLRRQIFEAIRLQKDHLPQKMDIVLIGKQATINLDFPELQKEISYILNKVIL